MDGVKSKMPFQVSRKARVDLTTQVAGGLRSAIACGVYKRGDLIPTILELARGLGVSEIVVRRAVQRLTREGCLNPRRGIGSVVAGIRSQTWHGRVLIVCQGGYDMYYQNVLAGVLAERLMAGHYLCSLVATPAAESPADLACLCGVLDQTVTLAVTLFSTPAVGRFFRSHRIDFMDVYPRAASREAAQTVLPDFVPALRSLGRWAAERNIHTVLQTRTYAAEMDAGKVLRAAGLRVTDLWIKPAEGQARPEAVAEAGLAGFRSWLAGRRTLPDLILCTDDYIGRGALLALLESGRRTPRDCRLVMLSNAGNRPLSLNPVPCIEMNPFRDGELVAERVLNWLGGLPCGHPLKLVPEFIPGKE